MNQEEFEVLRDLIHKKSGIFISDANHDQLLSCLKKRLKCLSESKAANYINRLSSDKEEMFQLIDEVSTNVTSFFREESHFDFIHRLTLEKYIKKVEPVRVWCAGSSSGEEVYSAAIALLEAGLDPRLIRVVGTDISCSALKKANDGLYKKKSLKKINQTIVNKYFSYDEKKDLYRVKDSLRRLVEFNQVNLVNIPSEERGPFDLIFCRNVMIYFKPELRAKLISEFSRLLVEDGYLFVGHSESLLEYKGEFSFVEPTVYQKLNKRKSK